MSAGKRLRNLRENKGMTVREIGERFNVASVTVNRWERDKFTPKRPKLMEMADFYGVSVDWILKGVESAKNDPAIEEAECSTGSEADEPLDSISKRLIHLRLGRNLSVREASKLLNVGKSTVHHWESGLCTPVRPALVRVAIFYNVSVDWILTGVNAAHSELEQRLGVPDELEELEPSHHIEPCEEPDKQADDNPIDSTVIEAGNPIDERNEKRLLSMFRKLSDCKKHHILGYLERMCVEEWD